MSENHPRPMPPAPDPRGWALDHARMARTATISAREALSCATPQVTIATALCAIAEALTSLAWTEAHPPRRYPVPPSTRIVNLDPPAGPNHG